MGISGSKVAVIGLGALLALTGTPAEAQNSGSTRHKLGGTDQNGEPNPVLFSADEVNYDDQLELVIARGNVELSQSGRTLLADVVSYNQRTDTVIASGNVSVIEDATGATVFANYVELHDNMRDGFIKDVRIVLADRSKLAANTGRRTDGNRVELRKGVYSPCDLCATDPTAPPLWQIKAEKVVHNREEQVVEYEDATLEIDGIPVAWTPYMSHPDPTVQRKSGFMPATIGSNSLLGLDAEIPYFWAISPSSDLLFSPIFTSNQGIVVAGEYRQRFSNGTIDIDASVTYSNPNISSSSNTQDDQLRGHIVAKGTFDLDENFRTGFDIERTSDIGYLEEYKIYGYQNFLNSNIYLEDFQGRDYGSIYSYAFQSLQSAVTDRSQPVVLPIADYTWAGAPMPWGGRFTTNLDVLDLLRETGPTEKRVSVGTQFDLPFSDPIGEKFDLIAGVRGDAYYVTAQPLVNNGPLYQGTTGRVFPQVGLEWNYPWAKQDGTSNWLIEPRAAFYAAPVGENPSQIPNIDSAQVDFNDTDLFSRDRFVGFDQVDGGQRVDYGLYGQWHDGSTSADGLIGQSYRFQKESPFAINGAGDGLLYQASDYVGRATYVPASWFDVTYHFRFNERDLASEREEVQTDFGPSYLRTSFSYLQLGNNVHDEETARQQVGATITLKATPFWTFSVNGTHDIAGDGHLLAAGASARYTDECTTFIASIGENGTVIGNIRPGTTILFQLILKNLGEIAAPSLQTGFSAE